MLKNPTTSVIVLVVTAVIIICVYILGISKTEEVVTQPDVVQVIPTDVVAPTDNAVETVVTPVTVTPAE
jgi:hypothetical protein